MWAPRTPSPVFLLALLGCTVPGCEGDFSVGSAALLDLDGRTVVPAVFEDPRVKAKVFIFTRTDCPISNRLAPEVRRLHATFAPRGVDFYLVYPDPDETPRAIETHRADYSYPMPALRDVRHELVRAAGARVTPEAAVLLPRGDFAYCGRLNDRFVDYGKARPAPTRHDLEEVLGAVLAGKSPPARRAAAVGCPIPPLRESPGVAGSEKDARTLRT